ncbi:MAG: integrase arm-type DNA-binding domain-containing protein, partial [Candidatus Accumulibacter sp.]|nr:integrase arm-type DNA-binding domain-containing protein [Accumulibacter sp.]
MYPAVSLKDARERRDEARKLLANDTDPGETKKARSRREQRIPLRPWQADGSRSGGTEVADSTAESQRNRLTKHITPVLGLLPVADMDAPKVLAALR